MKITKVWAVYFSPTGNTKKVITTMAKKAAEVLSVPMETFDFTLPENREGVTSFESEDLVFFSTPVYAGRIPNKMLPYVRALLREMAHLPYRYRYSETETLTTV